MEIEFVKATDEDLPFLTNLREQTMYDPLKKAGINLSQEEQHQRIITYYDFAYIIFQSNQKVGLLKYLEAENELKILQFQVLPEFQKKGIGRYVLNKLLLKARRSGKKITLKVLKNSAAVTFYKNTGFRILTSDKHEFVMQN